jgi:putative phosphoribosyl transferase
MRTTRKGLGVKPVFRNREEAAHLLAEKLLSYRGLKPLVLAVPRGGVPMGRIIADELNGELDVILVHKLRAPGNPEYAIGAVSEGGILYRPPYPQHLWVTKEYLDREIQTEIHALAERRKLYTPHHPAHSAANRIVILVDDGIATGSTLLAAMGELDAQKPAKVVVAAAVAPPEAVERLRSEADEMVVLTVRPDFQAIRDFFRDFSQVPDTEVVRILEKDPDWKLGPRKNSSQVAD